MSNIKNIIKRNVSILLEVDIADLPQKQVVKDKGAYNTAIALDMLDNIDQKFRELGVIVDDNEFTTIDILKSMQPFEMSFELKKSTKFFDGNTKIKGKAKIDDRHKGLRILFISDNGHKVRIDFDRKSLQDKQPQTGGDVTVLLEKRVYTVQLSDSKSGIEFGKTVITIPDETTSTKELETSGKRLSKIYFLTSKKGTTYNVAANPDKQDGVSKGFVNVTLIGDPSDPQPNKSFAVPKSKLEKTPDGNEYAYFPEGGGKPSRVLQKSTNQPVTTELKIISLPNIKSDSNGKDKNTKFELGKIIKVTGKLKTNEQLSFKNNITLDDINDKLNRGVEAELSASRYKDNVLKLNIGGAVVMLRPLSKDPDPYFVSNWNNLPIEIGSKASGEEEWKDIEGEATLNLI